MSVEQRIDDLIEAGWGVLDSDFDPIVFAHWRLRVFDCLKDILGSDHVYTRQFENFVRKGTKTDLIAATGIMSAAKQRITGDRLELIIANRSPKATLDLTKKT